MCRDYYGHSGAQTFGKKDKRYSGKQVRDIRKTAGNIQGKGQEMIYSEEEARREVIRAGLELKKKGLIVRTWGNVSARISETQFVITPSGRAYESLAPEDLVVVNVSDGQPAGPGKPSSEKGVHAECYRMRPDVGFVVHTHQTYATVLSTLGRDLDMSGKIVPCAEYGMSGTKELSDHVAEKLREYPDCRCVLMRNHGVVCLGADAGEAFAVAEALENASEKYFSELCGSAYKAENEMPSCSGTSEAENGLSLSSETGGNKVIILKSQAVRLAASYEEPLRAWIDDFGMMFGAEIPCLPIGSDGRAVTAALLPGVGAVCAAKTMDDAEAMAILLEKNCLAELLARKGLHPIPVDPDIARAEHRFYVETYSKLK